MTRRAPLPDAIAGKPFTTSDANALGVTRSRLRANDLARPHRGVRTPFPADGTVDRALAYSVLMEAGQFFSHLTAARLHGMRLPEGPLDDRLHVSSIAPMRAPRVSGVVGHRAPDSTRTVTIASGIRVSNPIETWCRLSELLTLDGLILAGDGLVCRVNPLATLDELRAAVSARGRRRGGARLRDALGWVREGTDSARETMLRLIVVRAGFPEPEVNGSIINRYGAQIARGDLTYPEFKTVLEYDGGQHREDERQFNIDIDRLDDIMEEGWRVIRVNKSLMARRATLLGKISTALRAGGWRPRPPKPLPS